MASEELHLTTEQIGKLREFARSVKFSNINKLHPTILLAGLNCVMEVTSGDFEVGTELFQGLINFILEDTAEGDILSKITVQDYQDQLISVTSKADNLDELTTGLAEIAAQIKLNPSYQREVEAYIARRKREVVLNLQRILDEGPISIINQMKEAGVYDVLKFPLEERELDETGKQIIQHCIDSMK